MRSWLALLSILVACALGARFLRQSGSSGDQSLHRVKVGLVRFWPGVDSDAQFQGQEMSVAVRFPEGTRKRQKQWTIHLLRWLAGEAFIVYDGASGKPIPDPLQAKPHPLKPNQDRDYWETVQSLKMQRYAQRDLDQKFGSGAALLLIDLESRGSHSDLPSPQLSDMDDYNSRRWAPGAFTISRIHACLVVSSPDLVEEAQLSVRPALDEKRGDDLRIVVIP